jgi:hypothetical protein
LNAAKPTMATGEARKLYAGLYRTIIRLGLLIAAAWLFAAFSFYLSGKTGTDWFSRSGAVMCLVGAAVTFRLSNFYQGALATALKEDLVSVSKESDRHCRNRGLGLWGPAGQTDVLSLSALPRRTAGIGPANDTAPLLFRLYRG